MGVNTYISIGNSDDRLGQAEWSRFIHEMRDLLQQFGGLLQIHGEWFSAPDQPWQNANWCVEPLTTFHQDMLKRAVRNVCMRFRQDTFAWTTGEVELAETGWAAAHAEAVALESPSTPGAVPVSAPKPASTGGGHRAADPERWFS